MPGDQHLGLLASGLARLRVLKLDVDFALSWSAFAQVSQSCVQLAQLELNADFNVEELVGMHSSLPLLPQLEILGALDVGSTAADRCVY